MTQNIKFNDIGWFMRMEDEVIKYYRFRGERLYDILKRFRPLYEEETYEALLQYDGNVNRKETMLEIIDSLFYVGAILSTIDSEVKPIRKVVISEYQKYVIDTVQKFNYKYLLRDWVLQVNGIYVYNILRIFDERKYHKKGHSSLDLDQQVDIVVKNFVKIFAKTISVIMIIVTEKDSPYKLHDVDTMINDKYANILAKATKNGRVR